MTRSTLLMATAASIAILAITTAVPVQASEMGRYVKAPPTAPTYQTSLIDQAVPAMTTIARQHIAQTKETVGQLGALGYMDAKKLFGDTGGTLGLTAKGTAIIASSVGFDVQKALAPAKKRDLLKAVARLDNAKHPAPAAFYTAASRGMFAS
ncbi:hypothetical protein A2704_00620 [Candidatus Kaiserbacteria bacterium RIFCSPHIGHO2_01_FULL_54_36b]|uniref:Uncharacterized protein n=1 Tax=Candidatus Kaiserbacteria bacterium RIFCSPHIGHO2_01_FULL_54_36b TaxID=1798483 RepID=A0A1F6CSK8_9BACT|nr:MAG: hypothetical protein A2704_00620 [Candidatus Kaiserbacteria bacterium RIFCSPHIGHO2_01_FULL_54_36b]